ncbi:MAG: hypothetical protein VB959_07765 [Rhodospirillales bacterium]
MSGRINDSFCKLVLDVLGISDFSDNSLSEDSEFDLNQIARTAESEILSGPLTTDLFKYVESFLKIHHVPPDRLKHVLSSGDHIARQKHIVLSKGVEIESFASWDMMQNPRKMATIFLCTDESSSNVSTAIDHSLDRISREVSLSAPSLMRLHVLPGHPITRKVAIAHGFRSDPGKEEHGTTFHKIAFGRVIDRQSWENDKKILKTLAGIELPSTIPNYESSNQPISVKLPSGQNASIPLQELETLLSPTIILLPGRPGAIAPIKRVFADELLGTAQQYSLITPPEAALLKERIYYNTPRAATIMVPGTIILFYESSDGGGRKSVIAVGRVTDSRVLNIDKVDTETMRKGVLDSKALRIIGNSDTKLVSTFDNILVFKKPVSLKNLTRIGYFDPANFRTARRIEAHHLINIMREGQNNG